MSYHVYSDRVVPWARGNPDEEWLGAVYTDGDVMISSLGCDRGVTDMHLLMLVMAYEAEHP